MPRYRLTRSAKADLAAILRTSEQRHGRDARIRYAALILAAVRRVAAVLLLPYLAWVTFAGVLNATLWRLNP